MWKGELVSIVYSVELEESVRKYVKIGVSNVVLNIIRPLNFILMEYDLDQFEWSYIKWVWVRLI